MSLKQIARGTLLIGFINVVRLLLQLLSVPLLARFLSPEDYGLTAMAMPVILFLMMIADAGLGNSLVRTGKVDEPAWHTCFWVSVALGTVAAIAVALLAPLVAFALDQPRLTPIIMALAAIIPMQTVTLVPGAALQKTGRFGTTAITEIVAICASIAAAVACAIMGLGVWTLVIQQIVFFAFRLTLTLACSPFRPRRIFDLADAWEHVLFGRDLLGVSLISAASRSLENLAIGRVYGPAPVGIYSMAFQFARLPSMLVTGPLQYVLYPHVAAIREDKAKIAALFLLLTRLLAIVFLPAVGLVAVASQPIFHLLLSTKWGQAAPIFLLIAPAAAFQSVTAILDTFLLALGRTDVQMRLAAQFAAFWLVGLMLSLWYGIEAVAAAYSVVALAFSLLWSLRVGLPLVNCSLAAYARCLRWPVNLDRVGNPPVPLSYRTSSSTGATKRRFSLAAALAGRAIAAAFVARATRLLLALSVSHYEPSGPTHSPIPRPACRNGDRR